MNTSAPHEHHGPAHGPAPVIELVYDLTCPNVERCREALRAAMAHVGLPPSWTEWDRNDPATPAVYRPYGSPTVLVDGRDIAAPPDTVADGTAATVALRAIPSGNSCRVYSDDAVGRLSGAPSVPSIVRALTVLGTSPTAESVA
jgi:mercuric ion transport protein